MKTIVKLTLVVCLMTSITLADDGDMGNGSKTCTVNCQTPTTSVEPVPTGEIETPTLVGDVAKFAAGLVEILF